MQRITIYGEHFTPVPFFLECIDRQLNGLQLPNGSGQAIHVACSFTGYIGVAEEVVRDCKADPDKHGGGVDALGWAFPVTSTRFVGRLWWEWAMLDGTLSRTLHAERKLGSFEETCRELLAAYQSPTAYGIKIGERPDYEGLVKLG